MSWEKVRLDSICEINMGKTPSRKNPSYWNGNNPWIAISDLKGEVYISKTKEGITDKAVKESGIKVVQPNTLLYSFKLSIGKTSITQIPIYTNEAIVALPIKDISKVNLKYLYYAIQQVDLSGIGDKAVKGITLNKEKLSRLQIPLPPLHIQKQIANILDKAEALRKKDQQLLQKYDELAQSIFIDMFGDPVKNEKGWVVKKLKELGKIQTGNTPSRAEKKFYGNHIEWIKSDNILMENIYPANAVEYLSEEGLKCGRIVNAGSLLITCIAGSPKTIGNVVLTDRKVAFNQQINSFTPKTGYDTLFMYFLFRNCKSIIQGSTTQGMKRIITKSTFENIQFILPPIKKQKEFTLKINTQILLMDKTKIQVDKSEILFQSLLQKAFTGELIGG